MLCEFGAKKHIKDYTGNKELNQWRSALKAVFPTDSESLEIDRFPLCAIIFSNRQARLPETGHSEDFRVFRSLGL